MASTRQSVVIHYHLDIRLAKHGVNHASMATLHAPGPDFCRILFFPALPPFGDHRLMFIGKLEIWGW